MDQVWRHSPAYGHRPEPRAACNLVTKTEVSAQGSEHVNNQRGRDSGSLRAEGFWRTLALNHAGRRLLLKVGVYFWDQWESQDQNLGC